MAKELDEEMGSPESNKLPIGRTPVRKALAGTIKRYVPQVVFLDDLGWGSKVVGQPFFLNRGGHGGQYVMVVPLEIIEPDHALGKARPFKDVRTI
jgi:hypothetical protein